MSQAKVDKYKKEKKNREKKIKIKKIRNFLICMVLVFVVSMGIGYPLGRFLYKKSYEKRMASATVDASSYDYYVQQYISSNYGYLFSYDEVESDTSALATDTDSVSE